MYLKNSTLHKKRNEKLVHKIKRFDSVLSYDVCNPASPLWWALQITEQQNNQVQEHFIPTGHHPHEQLVNHTVTANFKLFYSVILGQKKSGSDADNNIFICIIICLYCCRYVL